MDEVEGVGREGKGLVEVIELKVFQKQVSIHQSNVISLVQLRLLSAR